MIIAVRLRQLMLLLMLLGATFYRSREDQKQTKKQTVTDAQSNIPERGRKGTGRRRRRRGVGAGEEI